MGFDLKVDVHQPQIAHCYISPVTAIGRFCWRTLFLRGAENTPNAVALKERSRLHVLQKNRAPHNERSCSEWPRVRFSKENRSNRLEFFQAAWKKSFSTESAHSDTSHLDIRSKKAVTQVFYSGNLIRLQGSGHWRSVATDTLQSFKILECVV